MENRVTFTELLSDAMDKVVEHLDTCSIGKLNVPDAMDLILEPTHSDQSAVLHVETEILTPEIVSLLALHVETKSCSVKLTRLETTHYRLPLQSTSHCSFRPTSRVTFHPIQKCSHSSSNW